MSLQLAAQHLAAQGRGPDKQLVHMSPREVAGLQALAMAHGGSLTTNPETGLPEAGFLDNLLPTIIGAGLMYATGGASAAAMPGLFGMGMPATIGLGIGALETARTGNLQKGIMAGLGAYGGAGMFGALAGAGAAKAGAGAAQAAGPGMAITNPSATQEAFRLSEIAAQNAGAGNVPFDFGLSDPSLGLAEQAEIARLGVPMPGAAEAAQAAGRQSVTDFMANRGVGLGSAGEIVSVAPPPVTTPPATVPAAPAAVPAAPAAVPAAPPRGFLEGMAEVQAVEGPGVAGAGLPTRSTTLADRFAAMPTKDKLKYGLAALSPALLATPKYKAPELDREQYRYAYSPGPVMPPARRGSVGEYTYFQPSYTRLAEGGEVMDRARSTILGDNQYRYTYNPKTQKYTSVRPTISDESVRDLLDVPLPDIGGGGIGDISGPSMNANPASQIAFGQALQGYGQALGGMAPGGFIANFLGNSLVDAGVKAFSEMEAQASMNAAAGQAMNAHADAVTAAAQEGYAANADAAAGAAGAAAGAAAGQGLGYGGVGDSAGDGDGSGGFYARGGSISHLGDYSDGGRLLRGPGDGVSDSIPAMIGRKQPARLADGEFVVPARIVSELGNGSTDAGARKLYAMMDRIQKARGKTVGKGKVAKNSRAEKYLPA